MKWICSLSILLLCLHHTQAQDVRYNSIELDWGIGNLMRQDMTLSPFIHRDWSPVNIYLHYTRSKKLEHQVTLRFSTFNPMPGAPYELSSFYNGTLNTLPHSFKLVDFDYALGKELVHSAKWSFMAGGKSRNFLYASDYYFGESGPSPITISLGLDLWLKAVYRMNEKNYVESGLSIPLFSYVYRNPYLSQDDEYFEVIYEHNGWKELGRRIEQGKWRSWGNAQRVEFNVHYGYVINQTWELGLGYLFSVNLNQNPTPFTQVENLFLIGGKLNF